MAKIRVLVVEDSLTIRRRLVEVLSADPDLEVVGEAEDGKTGIELCQRMRPDVVTLDMMLPIMSGLGATEYIMAHCPTPIVIVSASLNRGELFRTYDALRAGAVDVLDKPTGDESNDEWERKLLSTVKLVSRIKVITHLRAKLEPFSRPLANLNWEATAPRSAEVKCKAIAIGVSTGGPAAIVEILRALPPRFPLPILLTIHIGAPFGAAFAEWLDDQSGVRVAFAKDGEPLPTIGDGRVLMAPPDLHLLIQNGRMRLSKERERHFCRPSVDVLFESVAIELGSAGAACLLTGMGRDGAEGLLAVRKAGGSTIAQDEASSVVFGMPREAIRLGAAERVLPLGAMAGAFVDLASGVGRRSKP